ncbi:MAG: hypothetical protein PHP00_12060 [Thiotrichaceae bacterium]|nr:hypothetical protein [Thiotrichaceae bacterium]
MPVGQASLDNTMSLTFGNEKSSILSVLPHYLLNNGFLLNRQAELDLQAFPNGVWERAKRKLVFTGLKAVKNLK